MGFTVSFYCCQRRPYWSDHRRPYWNYFSGVTKMKGKILTFNSCLVNTFRSSTLSRKCQSSHFLLCDATVLFRWSMQYGRRWLQFPNNRCSIQFYLWDQWVGHTTTCICLILIYKKLRHIFLSKFAFQVNCKKKLSRVTAPLVYIYIYSNVLCNSC